MESEETEENTGCHNMTEHMYLLRKYRATKSTNTNPNYIKLLNINDNIPQLVDMRKNGCGNCTATV
jgi:hypothetical protein